MLLFFFVQHELHAQLRVFIGVFCGEKEIPFSFREKTEDCHMN